MTTEAKIYSKQKELFGPILTALSWYLFIDDLQLFFG